MTEPSSEPKTPSTKIVNGNSSAPLRDLCAELHKEVEAFLQEDVKTETLKSAQRQCRHSLDIISEAIERYP